ncbi:MAG: LysR family transcriptional regulator [Rhizobiales bacterium]|nr:LysR family transcriptional regulator [Hyphomicrobiales bacterium]MBO6699367.1 LysR family transcriptional regulator [Hyphomicrobiales bacterium]MBO6736905.1 LysR family transcriptional regulator [Hyphomicrobiales bacterium]MBO6912021.1 LysR family transcriptional regulator [Hyphomicrobiales bacterium]MBO6954611.1 LysR family transcriptional regulator [Hyphomicrobiales bacterium]
MNGSSLWGRNGGPISTILQGVDGRDLEVLLAVAETGSFHRAAAQLRLGQSAVSRRVRKLEDLLGVSLFERRTTGARLTHAGSEFVACSHEIMEDLKNAVNRAQAHGAAENGVLRIGTMAPLSCGPQRRLIDSLLSEHPDIRLHFVEAERQRLISMLSHRSLDAVLSIGKPLALNGDCFPVWISEVHVSLSGQHPLASATNVSWCEIANEAFLVSSSKAGPDIHDLIIRGVSTVGRTARIVRQHLSKEGILGLVGLGLGISILTEEIEAARYPDMAFVPISDCEPVPFSLGWRPENDNPALRRFISLARIEAKRNGVLS